MYETNSLEGGRMRKDANINNLEIRGICKILSKRNYISTVL